MSEDVGSYLFKSKWKILNNILYIDRLETFNKD